MVFVTYEVCETVDCAIKGSESSRKSEGHRPENGEHRAAVVPFPVTLNYVIIR